MKDDKKTSELAARLSEMCLKIFVTSVAFSAVAFALAGRIRELPQFQAFASFALSGQKLGEQLADLENDPCWQLYSSVVSDPAAVNRTSLREISQIHCSDQEPTAVRVGTKTIAVTPSESHSAPPLAKSPRRTDLWLPPSEAEPIGQYVRVLWDDATLEEARHYSVAAHDEVDHWQLYRSQLSKRRIKDSAPEASPPESAFDISNLQFEDLEQIRKKMSHTNAADLDSAIRDQFRAPFPETSFGVSLGVASKVVAVILIILNLTLLSYVRAAMSADAKSTPGTIFHVLLGSSSGKLVTWTGLSVPLVGVVYLTYSVYVGGSAGLFFPACAIALLVVILSMLDRIFALRK